MSMADRDGLIWYDGKLVPWREATTHVLTHSLHYGLAVFEGLRAYKTVAGTAIFRLKEHTERLFNSAHIYMMKIPYDRETLMAAQKDVVRANKLDSCYVRPIAFYGSEKMGVSPKGARVHVAIAAWPWGAYLGSEGLEKGIRVKTSSYARHHVNVSMCRAKYSGTYANSILANMEATEHGYDEGLLLDVDGFVAEGAGENLFMIKNDKIVEPELNSALIGITRDSVIQLAGDLGGGLDHLATSAEQVQAGDPWGGQLAGAQAGIGVEADQRRKRWGDGGGGELLDLGGGQEVHLAAGMTALPVTRWHALMVRWPLP